MTEYDYGTYHWHCTPGTALGGAQLTQRINAVTTSVERGADLDCSVIGDSSGVPVVDVDLDELADLLLAPTGR
jgi:hypothetical protein